MIIFIAILTAVIVILLIASLFGKKQTHFSQPMTEEKKPFFNLCPLCGTALQRGQNVRTVLYPLQKGCYDRPAEIYGCPSCDPEKAAMKAEPRLCPVCKKQIPPKGCLIARFFEKPGKKHIHVLGCSGCYTRK